jgi:L-Ala-D/L-Glu epimerase
MRLAVRHAKLPLAETFTIARESREEEEVLYVELEHEGVVGHGECSPVDYWGETTETARAFLEEEAPALLGDDPRRLEWISQRMREREGEQAAKCALDAALHDWIGKRLGQPVWRLFGLDPDPPPTSFTIGIDTVEGTIDKTRRAQGFEVLKIKVGGPDDLARLQAVRENTTARIRIDGNEGWTLETARELMPQLADWGVEFVEQPFPAGDIDAYLALRELEPRVPVVIDEGCRDLRDVAPIARYADGINIKLTKAGGLREALRMVAAARALDLKIMLGCMVESQLAVAHAVQISPLVDYADLDGHLLLAESPYEGLRLENGRVLPSDEPGLGVHPIHDRREAA